MNPALAGGLPVLRYPDLGGALAAMHSEAERFLATAEHPSLYTHPIFGDIDRESWWRTHYKHCHHHLAQFGLTPGA
jgi:hypothetical protein